MLETRIFLYTSFSGRQAAAIPELAGELRWGAESLPCEFSRIFDSALEAASSFFFRRYTNANELRARGLIVAAMGVRNKRCALLFASEFLIKSLGNIEYNTEQKLFA